MPLPLLAVPAVISGIGVYFAAKEIGSILATVIKGGFAFIAIAVYVAFIYFFIDGFKDMYYLIKDFIGVVEVGAVSDSTSSIVTNFFGLLNCIGFLSGVSAVKGIILSALSWRLISNLTIRFTIFTYMTYGALSKALSK